MTTPNAAPLVTVKWAIEGVGITPASRTSIPLEARPAAIADSSISPDARVSLPTTTFGEIAFLTSTRAAACASFRADAAVIGSLFAVPRTPSVPKSFCDTGYIREAVPRDQLVIGGSFFGVSLIVLLLELIFGH